MTAVSTSKHPARIAGMFDAIAPRYDALNHLLSAGLDRVLAAARGPGAGADRIASACSTCARARPTWRSRRRRPPTGRAATVIGIDFAGEMLRLGAVKVRGAGLGRPDPSGSRQTPRACRCPTPPATPRRSRSAFAMCSIRCWPAANSRASYAPGGRLAVLEFGAPTIPGCRAAVRVVLPGSTAADRASDLEARRGLFRICRPRWRSSRRRRHSWRCCGAAGFPHVRHVRAHVRDRVPVSSPSDSGIDHLNGTAQTPAPVPASYTSSVDGRYVNCFPGLVADVPRFRGQPAGHAARAAGAHAPRARAAGGRRRTSSCSSATSWRPRASGPSRSTICSRPTSNCGTCQIEPPIDRRAIPKARAALRSRSPIDDA